MYLHTIIDLFPYVTQVVVAFKLHVCTCMCKERTWNEDAKKLFMLRMLCLYMYMYADVIIHVHVTECTCMDVCFLPH